jgi:hypothetical protein
MKSSNEYAAKFGPLYSKIPKAVFAAVAFSYAASGGDDMTHGVERFLEEWRILCDNGFVERRPPKAQILHVAEVI